jgi:V8-like Glu-specific endopeptidase
MHSFSAAGARYIRVRVEVATPRACRWHLTVRDAEFRVVQTLTPDDFSADTKSRWTTRVKGATAFINLERCRGVPTPEIRFPEFISMLGKAENSYYSKDDAMSPAIPLYEVQFDVDGYEMRPLGDYTGFLMGNWDKSAWTCSGVMVARDLFLTNWHCGSPGKFLADDGRWKQFREDGYWDALIWKSMIVDLSFDTDDLSREYIVSEVLAFDPVLDFALLKVEPLNALGSARPVPITLTPVKEGDDLRIVHHPEGKQKHISYQKCQVVNEKYESWRGGVPDTDFTHRCTTEFGSSGAPVFNSSGHLVGLHHVGFKFETNPCRQMDSLNKAVHIKQITDFLWKKHRPLYDQLTIIKQ